MKVLNYGSLNYDYVYSVEHINQPGETQSCSSRNTFCGGKGLNQSIALAKAGVPVFQGGLVGDDGEMLLEKCRENGVNTDYTGKTEGPSGHAVIQLDASAENSIIIYGGANQSQTKDKIDQTLDSFEEGDILLLQNEVNLVNYLIERAYEKKMKIILNPSPWNEKMEQCDLKKVSVFLINEIEGGQISGKTEPEDILAAMGKMFPDAEVVLTLGSKGAIYQGKGKTLSQPAFLTDVVDTTAAGDTFTGYFIAGLTEGLSMKDNLQRAAKASSIAVSRMGATDSIPMLEEVL
jgi:ribokinase